MKPNPIMGIADRRATIRNWRLVGSSTTLLLEGDEDGDDKKRSVKGFRRAR